MVKTEKVEMSERQATKKKLMAATSMLLVACIMLVSASYAWFTLSTHPEITGIATNVGANGSLEIALANGSTWDAPDTIKTKTSTATVVDSNVSWGNLVSLEDSSYGLSQITLYPSRLNYTTSTADNSASITTLAVSESPLLTPKYGTDGRIKELVETLYANYTGSKFDAADVGRAEGVNAIGTSEGMTDRQAAYRSQRIGFLNGASSAKTDTAASLQENGSALANIIVARAVDDNPQYNSYDYNAIGNVITALENMAEDLDSTWENAVLAYVASSTVERSGDDLDTEAEFNSWKTAFTGENGYTYSNGKVTANGVEVELPTSIVSFKEKIDTIKRSIASARTAYNAIQPETNDSYTWTSFSSTLNLLVDKDHITVNDIKTSELMANANALVNAVTKGQGISVQMNDGSGLFYDIAVLCGNYTASILLDLGAIDSSAFDIQVEAKMVTNAAASSCADAVTSDITGNAPTGAGSADNVLTDMYGYQLDFFLRTNASSSNVSLQKDAAQRIYSDSTNEETLGNGSNMTFTSTTLGTDSMVNLMKGIRIVFMDGESKILGLAVLDLGSTTTGEGETAVTKPNYEVVDGKVTASMKLVNASVLNGVITIDESSEADQTIIKSMAANTATKVSVLVYLDGDAVDNADVSPTATKSLSGTMNLQFTSDATLTPMENTALRDGTAEEVQPGTGN